MVRDIRMGVIINDEITLDNGIDISSTYAAIGLVTIQKIDTNSYSVESIFKIYKDQTARNEGKPHLFAVPVSLVMAMNGLSTLFPQLFTQFKTGYSSTTDAF